MGIDEARELVFDLGEEEERDINDKNRGVEMRI
jgi:hypothetical protein